MLTLTHNTESPKDEPTVLACLYHFCLTVNVIGFTVHTVSGEFKTRILTTNSFSFSFRSTSLSLLIQTFSRLGRVPKVNFWEMSKQEFLQAGHAFCHQPTMSKHFKSAGKSSEREDNWLIFTLMTTRPDLLPRLSDLFSVTNTVLPNSSTLPILASP